MDTIAILNDKLPDKAVCPYRCTDQKTVDTNTGKCSKCGRVFEIHCNNKVAVPVE